MKGIVARDVTELQRITKYYKQLLSQIIRSIYPTINYNILDAFNHKGQH